MKKIIVAPDSFKGSLSAEEVSKGVQRGILNVLPDVNILKFPISDGGEGFVRCIIEAIGGSYRTIYVHDPLMRSIKTYYGIMEDKTAIIEMASASGLTLLNVDERNPMETTTYGTGEIIKDAIKMGCKCIILGVGGSATNDGGTGMLQALGFRFLNKDGMELGVGGKILSEIHAMDDANSLHALKDTELIIACDVDNPFYGNEGAAFTFAAQKGASGEMINELDKGLQHLALVIKKYSGIDIQKYKGAGAAGGLAGAGFVFLGAKIVSGIDLVLDIIGFDEQIDDADLVITGEGKMDAQTKRGKATFGVLKRARKHNIPIIALAGIIEDKADLIVAGFTAIVSINPSSMNINEAMNPDMAKKNIEKTTDRIIKNCMMSRINLRKT